MSTPSIDHYAVLGVAPTASAEEIRRAYRDLSKIHHPDRGGDAAHFADITASYSVLSDPSARDFYDVERRLAQLRATQAQSPAAAPSAHEQWASVVFGDAPARPSAPAAASPRPPTNYADPLAQRASTLRYARHRFVSYAAAAVLGALWWPLQYLLAHLDPATTGPRHQLQHAILSGVAPVLVLALGGLGLYVEHRFFPVHVLRTSPRPWTKWVTTTGVTIVLTFNLYLAQPLVAAVAAVVFVLALLVAPRTRGVSPLAQVRRDLARVVRSH